MPSKAFERPAPRRCELRCRQSRKANAVEGRVKNFTTSLPYWRFRIRTPHQFIVGGVTERPNVPVLKTGDLARGPRVQISPPPPKVSSRLLLRMPTGGYW